MIPFNKPYLTGKEAHYIYQAVYSLKISGNGMFTKRCQAFFENIYGFKKCLLTTSCTDALEMTALLMELKKGDQIILPSYTFVSTANAFVLHGADLVFADSEKETPNIDAEGIEELITPKTKAIVVVHYGGVACDMEKIMNIANKHHLFVIEDAAHAIDSYYKNKPLGSFGHFATFSFHETKNITSGEGGMLVINDERFIERAEIIWEKGTNRAAFFRGEVDKYNWVDIGSSYLPSEVVAAFLYAQIENLQDIQNKRKEIWNYYFERLKPLEKEGFISLPFIPAHCWQNGHLFYVTLKNINQRLSFIDFLKQKGIQTVFHYLSLHNSPFYKNKHDGRKLVFSDQYSDLLTRLPLFYELGISEQEYICKSINSFFIK